MAQIITEPTVDRAFADGQQQLAVSANAIVTPAAADRARSLNLTIVREGNGVTAPAAAPGPAAPPVPAQNGERWIPPRATAQPQTRRPAAQLCDFDRVRSVIGKYGLDGIVAAVPHNVYYLSGFDTEPLWEFPWMAQVVVPLHGEPALILGGLDLIAPIESELWIEDLYPYSRGELIVYDAESLLEFEQGLMDLKAGVAGRMSGSNMEAIVSALRDRGILNGKLGFDDTRIIARLPVEGLDAVDAIDLMREIRMIKTEAEIDKMRTIGIINEKAALAAAHSIPQAQRWQDVINTYRIEMINQDAEARYMIGGAQHHTGTHQHVHDYKPQPGDFFMVDALGAKDHYYGDFGRTVSWGEPDPRVKKRFDAMRKGFEAGLEKARPGVPFEELNDHVREVIRREGNEHHRISTAHSVGLEHTDMPRWPGHIVEPNITMNVDIAYLEAGFGALHLEDTFVVRPNGTDLLTSGKTGMIIV